MRTLRIGLLPAGAAGAAPVRSRKARSLQGWRQPWWFSLSSRSSSRSPRMSPACQIPAVAPPSVKELTGRQAGSTYACPRHRPAARRWSRPSWLRAGSRRRRSAGTQFGDYRQMLGENGNPGTPAMPRLTKRWDELYAEFGTKATSAVSKDCTGELDRMKKHGRGHPDGLVQHVRLRHGRAAQPCRARPRARREHARVRPAAGRARLDVHRAPGGGPEVEPRPGPAA